jgi:hypothetical protein
MNHAFADGNNRVAWASSSVFLRVNGYRVRVNADDAERFLIEEVIVGHAELAAIAEWLRSTCVRFEGIGSARQARAPQRAGTRRTVGFHHLRDTCPSNLLTGTLGRKWSAVEVPSTLGHSSTWVTRTLRPPTPKRRPPNTRAKVPILPHSADTRVVVATVRLPGG